jgi:C-terminal peptidase prc
MYRVKRLALLAALAVMATLAPWARAEDKATSKTYLVLVGVSTFDDPAITSRPAAEKDAKALYQLFTNKDYLGVDPANARLLLGTEDKDLKSEPATKANILKAIRWAAEKANKDDMVIFGVLGRGGPVGDRTCFFTRESTVKDRAKDALATADIEHELEKLKSEKMVAIVDVDYKGVTLDKNSVVEPSVLDMVRVFVGNEDKEEHALPPGRVIFMASNTIAKHIDVDDQSIFIKVLLDGLKGKADVDGYEPDGVVTVEEIQNYLEKEVPALARTLGSTREEKEQAAFAWGSRNSHYILTKNPAVAPKAEARIAKLGTLELPKDVLEEATRWIHRMPKLKAQQEMRKNYVKLADGQIDAKTLLEIRDKHIAAAKLDREDAEAFAEKVLRGAEAVKRGYVKELILGEMISGGIKGMYRALEEKVPADIQEKLLKAQDQRRGQLSDLLADAREHLGKREDLESNKDVDMALRTMMYNLDPYSTYFDKEQIRQMQSQMTGQYPGGIGVQIRRDMVRDGLLVVTPIKGSPAYQKGLKAGDLITEIIREVDSEGKKLDPPEVISTKGMKTDDAVKKILGTPRTAVKVKVVREGVAEPIVYELTRGLISVETVMGTKRNPDDSWDYIIDPDSKIAYMRLTQFSPRSYQDMVDVMKSLEAKKIKGLVLDLRFNPGGLLTSAVQISDLFIDDGVIVKIRPRPGFEDEQAYTGKHENSYLNFPMVCMVNGLSASGSEIVAACLQDHNRAMILGERSYGKGSVQNIMDFPATGAKIKLTTATFWRPSDKNLNKASTNGKDDEEWGVRPDDGFNIPITRGEREALFEQLRDSEVIPNRDLKPKEAKPPIKDKQLDAALDYLRNQIKTTAKVTGK